MKPENILLDELGNCCLCDFGLCKKLSDPHDDDEKTCSTRTFCGTPEYLAPEIIRKQAYDQNCDWWSLGILLFELTVGIVPFFSSSKMEMYQKITDAPLMFASWIDEDCQNLIELLLQRDVGKRLGFKDDVDEIKEHKWFVDIDWNKVLNKEYDPPFVPEIEEKDDLTDMTCVADKYMQQSTRDTIVDKKVKEKEQAHFRGFTFRGIGTEDEVDDANNRGSPSYSITTPHHQPHLSAASNYSTVLAKANSTDGGLEEAEESDYSDE